MKKENALSPVGIIVCTFNGAGKVGIVGGAVLAKTNEALSSSSRAGLYLGLITDLKIGKNGFFKTATQIYNKRPAKYFREKRELQLSGSSYKHCL